MAAIPISIWGLFLACAVVDVALVKSESGDGKQTPVSTRPTTGKLLRREPDVEQGPTAPCNDLSQLVDGALREESSLVTMDASSGRRRRNGADRRRLKAGIHEAHHSDPDYDRHRRRRRERRRREKLEELRKKDAVHHDCALKALQEIDDIDVQDRKEGSQERELQKDLQLNRHKETMKTIELQQSLQARDSEFARDKDREDMETFKHGLDQWEERRHDSKKRQDVLKHDRDLRTEARSERNRREKEHGIVVQASLGQEQTEKTSRVSSGWLAQLVADVAKKRARLRLGALRTSSMPASA